MNFFLFQVTLALCFFSSSNGWETPSPHQYHIQTDEGPQRYFRYQTDSGQYRKEKRLEDGTIIGTYAWIDADGILRQRDYIADNAGYRILKTKNIFVGRNVNVGDAIKAVKKYPASAGTLVKSNQRPVVSVPYNAPVSNVPAPYQSTTPASVLSTTTVRPYTEIPQSEYVSTPAIIVGSTPSPAPVVEITPHSYISSTSQPLLLQQPGINLTSINNYIPPVVSSTPVYYEATTSAEQYVPTIPPTTPAPIQVVSTLGPVEYDPTQRPNYDYVPQIYSKEVDQNSLDYNPYVRQGNQGYRFQNGPTYPLDQNGRPYNGNGIDSQQQSTYDGVSVTNDGFRYYIPRAYHEEQTLPGDTRSGSFGYIDPFGIRRVIYYNAAPGTGFQHRKNNRYVGFQATPYDPRPPY